MTTGFQSHTKTTSVNSNLIMDNTENTTNIFPSEVTQISLRTSSTLVPLYVKPLQIPRKTSGGSSDFHNDQNISLKSSFRF